jgi:hypothetical protein
VAQAFLPVWSRLAWYVPGHREMRTVSWAPEWMQRVSRIALYLALIGATILTSTLIAHWLHPR